MAWPRLVAVAACARVAAGAVSSGCGVESTDILEYVGMESLPLALDGHNHILTLPQDYDASTPVPLILYMHGWGGDASEAGRPGFLAFADPFSPIPVALAVLDAAHPASVVAGGLSCPVSQEQPSLWLQVPGAGGRALPPGSLVGVALRGEHFEMHSLCAQGAAPVGPSFTVTKGQGNVVEELDGRPALEQLSRIAQKSDAVSYTHLTLPTKA